MKLIKLFIVPLFAVLAGTPVLAQQREPVKSEPGREPVLRVMSYNIRICSPPAMKWNGTDLPGTAAAIKKYSPDLVALQEVDAFTDRAGKTVDQAKELGRLTGMYAHFAKAVDRSNGDYGVAVLSRFPILKAESYRLTVLSKHPDAEVRGVAAITVKTPVGKIVFLSVHLDHLSDSDREHQIRQLMTIVKKYEKMPVIIGADLNTIPTNPVLAGFSPFFERLCTECQFTFPADKPDRTLDYVLLNQKAFKRMNVIRYTTLDEPVVSDHLPLLVSLESSRKKKHRVR